MKKEPIILIGGGGHCKSCIDVIESENKYEIKGILDLPPMVGRSVLSYPIIGTDDDIEDLVKKYSSFFITVGQIGYPVVRTKIFDKIKRLGLSLPLIVSPSAYVSKFASLGNGTIVMHGVHINAEAKIGINCIINSSALIEHEAIIGDHTHISTCVIINGQCVVGDNCFIGSGTILGNNVQIVDNVIISAGSIVLRSIEQQGTYIGNPLRRVKK